MSEQARKTITALAGKIEQLEKQRDELLAAIELIYSWANNWDSEFMNDPEWTDKDYPHIQSVIASAKEKP